MHPNQFPSCENVVAVADEPHHHLVIDNEWLRAYAVELAPGQSTLCHVHSLPYLMYVAGDAEIVSSPKDGEARKHHYLDMYCEFSPAGLQHFVENLAATPFRNLIFEVLPAADSKRRAGLPFANAAGVRARTLYSGESICAQYLELSSGAQTQVTGPAIVATAYDDVIEFISPERGARKLQDFQQLEYVPEGSTGLVRCESGKPARVVVVSIGCE